MLYFLTGKVFFSSKPFAVVFRALAENHPAQEMGEEGRKTLYTGLFFLACVMQVLRIQNAATQESPNGSHISHSRYKQ